MSGVCSSHKDWGKERHVLESQGEFWGVSLKAEPPMILLERTGMVLGWGGLSTDVLGPFRGNAWRKFL